MARALLIPNAHNATIKELKQVSRVGSNETATRCTAIQMLLAGADRTLVCNALLVTNRALRRWINGFNQRGVDSGSLLSQARLCIKTPQPWPDKQDDQLRETLLQELQQLFDQPDVDIWFADESGFEGDPSP
jgi:hypothetical protein